jgi:hypothetical protein
MNTTHLRSRRGARAIGAVSAVAVTAGLALCAPGVASAAETVTAGELSWGVKQSFRSYITGPIAHGSATPAAGASTAADGTYRFPGDGGTVDGGSVLADFGGSVHFVGHAGQLDMLVEDIRISISGTSGVLIADVTSKGFGAAAPTLYDDVEFADLDLTGISPTTAGTQQTWSAIPAVLTAEGSPAFAGFYPAGSALDPVTFTVDTAGDPDPGGEPEPPAADEQELSVVVPAVEPEPEPGTFAWEITGDGSAVSLGTAALQDGRLVASGQIKPVTVTDTRSTANAWTISAQVSDFVAGSTTVSGKHLGWAPEVVSAGAGAAAGPAVAPGTTSGNGLKDTAVLGSAPNGHAPGAATLGAELDLSLPSTTSAGTYGATLTLTALS